CFRQTEPMPPGRGRKCLRRGRTGCPTTWRGGELLRSSRRGRHRPCPQPTDERPCLSSYPECACLRPTRRDFCAFHARTAFDEGHAGVRVELSAPSFTQLRRFVLTFGQYLDMADCGPIHSPFHGV